MGGDVRAAFDAFISFKSEDEAHARALHELLVGEGLQVFFSRESLPRIGSDQYRKEIDAAVDRAHHMVVVTSSPDHVTSKWVEHEWGLFLGELLAGRKTGNLITVLAGAMRVEQLPISLRNREVIRLRPEELPRLIEFTRVTRAPAGDSGAPLPVLAELLSGDQDRIRLGIGRVPPAARPRYLAALRSSAVSASPVARRSSLMALFLMNDPDLGSALIAAANDADPTVRRQAMFLIGRARVLRARDLVSVRLSDGNAEVRAAAREAHRKLTGGKA